MKVISLFSGIGGFDLGFEKAGAEIIWANDIDKIAVETYKKNFKKNNIICEDIKNVKMKNIPNNADIIIGGFPCIGFTIAKSKYRNIEEDVNNLYKQYIKVLKNKLTKYFVIENVTGIKTKGKFEVFFNKMLQEFEDVGKNNKKTKYKGYKVKYKILNAKNYLIPQNRKRVIIYGIRGDLEENIDFPNEFEKKITIQDAIKDLPVDYNFEYKIKNHTGTKHKVKINNFQGNRILKWDKQSPTIIGRGSKKGGPVIHPHPNLKRRLSIREVARLQSFPDDYIFYGSNSNQYAHIGNAVPPILSFMIAKMFMKDKIIEEEIKEKFKLPWFF